MLTRYRCLSLWEPWASLIANGQKTIETRMQPTKVRGDILICATLTTSLGIREYIQAYVRCGCLPEDFEPKHGQAVAVVELYDCQPLREEHLPRAVRVDPYIDPGTWGWHLRNIRPLTTPVDVRGAQGFFYRELSLQLEET